MDTFQRCLDMDTGTWIVSMDTEMDVFILEYFIHLIWCM